MAFRPLRSLPRALATFLATSAALLFLPGCNKSPGGPAATSEVRIGYFPNLAHAQAVLAVDSGDLELALTPHVLRTRVFNAGPSLIEALLAGNIDVGYVGPGPVLSANAVSHGQAIRVICGASANGVVIVARPRSGIASMKDLAGKHIATPQHGNTQDISARHYVCAVLGQSDDNNVLPIPVAEQAVMMSRGDCDAAWVPEPWGSLLVSQLGAQVIAEEKDLWPGRQFSLAVVVTTPQFLQQHPDVIETILTVHRRWTRKLQNAPVECAKQLGSVLARLTGKELPPTVLTQAIKRVTFTDEPLQETFQTMGQWAYDLRLSQRPPDLDALFDLQILRRLQRQEP